MKFSRAFIGKAVHGDEAAAREIYPVLRHCAGVACSRQKLMVYADDVASEMWLFLREHHRRIDPAYNIEPFMIRVAEFILKAHYRRFGMYGTGGLPGESPDDAPSDEARENARASEHELDESFSAHDEKIDSQRAIQALMLRSPSLRKDVHIERESSMSGVAKPQARAGHKTFNVTSEQKLLKSMRIALGFTQRRMAFLLGIRLCTYQSYEYGRTLTVPPRIMEQMRDFSLTADKRETKGRAPVGVADKKRPKVRSATKASRRRPGSSKLSSRPARQKPGNRPSRTTPVTPGAARAVARKRASPKSPPKKTLGTRKKPSSRSSVHVRKNRRI